MRVNRAKQIRKHLRFYKVTYGICGPYHIILDGNFIYTALKFNIDLQERLKRTLQGETLVFYVTESSLEELRTLGEKGLKALQYAEMFCTTIDDRPYDGVEPNDKIVTFLADRTLQKTRRYFVATQDQELRNYIAGVVTGVPLLYLNKVTLVLEPPSEKSRGSGAQAEGAGFEEVQILTRLSESARRREASSESGPVVGPVERKKRKATAPNPLSQRKPSDDSKTSKRKKTEHFKRGGH